MRAALGAAIAAILVLGPACTTTTWRCDACGGPFVMDLLISEQGAIVPVGVFQTVGVLIPGSGGSLSPSIADRVMVQGTGHDPHGSTLLSVQPTSGAAFGQPEHFGGSVSLAASSGSLRSPWSITLDIATDPLSDHDLHTYLGSGTTVMQVGQTFVMTWAVGSAPPMTSDPSILRPSTDPVENVTQPVGETTVHAVSYMEQVFVAAGTGRAVLTASSAFDPKNGRSFGPSQRFIVRDDPRWTCSPAAGCSTPVASQDNSRPDHYFAAGVTPSV